MTTLTTTEPDPLDNAPDPQRLHYQLGVMLNADDLLDEQTYHRGRLARALAYLHGTGTAAGLAVKVVGPSTVDPDVVPPPAEEEVRVEAGLAVDRLGRLVEVPRPACIRVAPWLAAQDVALLTALLTKRPTLIADVFLRFVACDTGFTPSFATGPFDATDAVAPARVRDAYELRLVVREEDTLPAWVDPWAALRTSANRTQDLAGLIKGSWKAAQSPDLLVPVTLDRTLSWVFLARVSLPITITAGKAVRTADAATVDDVTARPFVYSTAALIDLVAS